MGIREKLHEKQHITITVVSLIIVLSLAFIIYTSVGGKDAPPVIYDKAYFTTDDGATWFADDAKKVPPFKTKDGKTAVRAHVFKCGDGKPFVAYLQRYTAAAKNQLEGKGGTEEDTDPGYGPSSGAAQVYLGVQLKKPGESDWLPAQNPASALVRTPVCPDGKTDAPQPVRPEPGTL